MPVSRPDLTHAAQSASGTRLTLRHYPGEGFQSRHVHDHTQLSFLLAGEMQESIGRKSHDVAVPSFCIKPAGTDHEDRWGRAGVLMFSANFRSSDIALPRGVVRAAWCRAPAGTLGMLVKQIVASKGGGDADELLTDLIANLHPAPAITGEAPLWLRRVRESIKDCPNRSIAEAARDAGVHRVHLSRSFARHYGLPFSIYRHRLMVARAVEATVRSSEGLAQVALSAGFADQSHMTRAVQHGAGVTPRRLRRLLNAAYVSG